MQLRDFVPPIFFSLITKLRHTSRKDLHFSSFKEAQKSCFGQDFQEEEYLEIIFKKTKALRDRLKALPLHLVNIELQLLMAIGFARKQPALSVLDFGGACGAHYFTAKAAFPDCSFRWHVVETPAMIKKAQVFANDELQFFPSLEEFTKRAAPIDLLISSSTVQYVDDPIGLLEQFSQTGAGFIFLNRCCVSEEATMIVTVHETLLSQNGPGPFPPGFTDKKCRFPVQYLQEKNFFLPFETDYFQMLHFEERSSVQVVPGQRIRGFGVLFKRRKW